MTTIITERAAFQSGADLVPGPKRALLDADTQLENALCKLGGTTTETEHSAAAVGAHHALMHYIKITGQMMVAAQFAKRESDESAAAREDMELAPKHYADFGA